MTDPYLGKYSRNLVTGPAITDARYHFEFDTSPDGPEQVRTKSHYFKQTLGNNIPNFHKRKARGELLPYTSFYQFEARGSQLPGTFRVDGPSGYWSEAVPNYSPFVNGYSDWQFILPQSEINQFLDLDNAEYHVAQAAANVYAQGWDGLTFAAELGKTLIMFRNMGTRLVQFLGNLRSQGIRGASYNDLLNQPFKDWLEFRYGWRILLYDYENFVEFVEKVDDGRKRFKNRAGRTETDTLSTVTHDRSQASNGYSWDVNDLINYSYRGSIVADIEPPKLGLNPIRTAWELLTLSFVIDWFLNIGQWLETMSFLTLTRDYSAAAGVHLEYERHMLMYDTTWTAGYSGTVYAEASGTHTITAREPSTVPLIPQAGVRLDALKVIDLLALIKQLVIGRI